MSPRRFWLPLMALALFALPVQSRAEDKMDRAQVEAIVRQYILDHPEIIEQAQTALQARQAAAEAERQKQALSEIGPMLDNAPQNAVLGDPNGDVTLIEFFDYNCGYCKRGFSDLKRLLDTDKKLKVILRDYPILAPGSVQAAMVAVAVKEQASGDRFLKFHEALLLGDGQADRDRALEVAKEQGFDMKKIEASMTRQQTRAQLAENLKIGDTLGISGTPSYIIGNEIVPGAVGYDALKQRIDSMRKCGSTSCG